MSSSRWSTHDAAYALIEVAQEALETTPCGGVGADGVTRVEIVLAEAAGRCVEDDAAYHAAQSAWLALDAALKTLRGDKE